MNIDNRIDNAVEAIKAEPIDEAEMERAKAAVLHRLGEIELPEIAGSTVSRRRWLRAISAGAVAAGVAFAAMGPLNLFAPKSLYAQAIDKLSRGGLAYSMTRLGQNGEVLSVTKLWVAKDGRRRREVGDHVMIDDPFGNPRLVYSMADTEKKATVFKGAFRTTRPTFENSWFGPLANPQRTTHVGTESSGSRGLEHFRVEPGAPNLVFDVWIDVQAQAVTRVEFMETRDPTAAGKYIVSDFQVEQDFDESLFSTTPPPGYSVEVVELPAVR